MGSCSSSEEVAAVNKKFTVRIEINLTNAANIVFLRWLETEEIYYRQKIQDKGFTFEFKKVDYPRIEHTLAKIINIY